MYLQIVLVALKMAFILTVPGDRVREADNYWYVLPAISEGEVSLRIVN